MARADEDGDGAIGWGVNMDDDRRACAGPGTRPGLRYGETTCNPAGNEYTYQTGLVMACLSRVHLITGDKQLLDTAKGAAEASWNIGDADKPCRGAFTYWPSYHSNDAKRYIRNMNVAMGMGLAWLHKATGDERYKNRALQVAKAESCELAAGNKGYLGSDDPQFLARPKPESARTENHMLLVAKALDDIGWLLNNPAAGRSAQLALMDWINCADSRCKSSKCEYWAGDTSRCTNDVMLYACAVRTGGDAARSFCSRALNAAATTSSTALWSIIDTR